MAKPVQRRRGVGEPFGSWREIDIVGVTVSEGGWYGGRTWLTGAEVEAAEKRWALRAYAVGKPDEHGWVEHQCGGCRFMGALDADWGLCLNPASPQDGCVVFEHGGCPMHSSRVQVKPALPGEPVSNETAAGRNHGASEEARP